MNTEYTRSIKFDAIHLQTLRAQLQGQALVPGDDGYDKARLTWSARTFEQYPAIIVLPAVSADVSVAVIFAREHELPVAVQGGGHGHPRAADGALLVNFMHMTGIQINGESATARVEAGVKSKDVVQAASPYGLAPLNGLASTVGFVGYLLGGGIGWLTRQYGPGASSIRSVELVTAAGELLQVNENSHPDLFWGLRGSGGNFGIITSLECSLYPVREIFGGQVVYPIAQGKEVLQTYLQWIKTVPDELTSVVRIMHFPDIPAIPPVLRGRSTIICLASYNGTEEEGEALLQPLRTLGEPLLDTFAQIPYSQVATISNDPVEAPPFFLHTESGALQELEKGEIATIVDLAGDPTSGLRLVELRHLGGAFAHQQKSSMPSGNYQATLHLSMMAGAPTVDQLQAGRKVITTIIEALRPGMTGEVLLNLAGSHTSPERVRAAFSTENYQRLVALKDRYDSKNIFRFNHNIPPSAPREDKLT